MSAKGKGINNHTEVVSARSRLGATLQNLREKKDDAPVYNIDSLSDAVDIISREPSPVSSPRKIQLFGNRESTKSNRKRKRRDEETPEIVQSPREFNQTYIMKLFDRSVDLAQFNMTSSLYPICREWMRNHPNSKDSQRSKTIIESIKQTDSDDELEKLPDIHKLPSPIKHDPHDETDYRIPDILPTTDEPLDINADPETAPAPENLLLNHMNRWKDIRESWRIASIQNEMRYAPSMNMLRDMFELQMKDG